MRKVKFVSVFMSVALLLSVSAGAAMSQKPPPAQDNLCAAVASQPQDTYLQPGVWGFIAGTYLAHSAEYPDENEPVPLLHAYLEG